MTGLAGAFLRAATGSDDRERAAKGQMMRLTREQAKATIKDVVAEAHAAGHDKGYAAGLAEGERRGMVRAAKLCDERAAEHARRHAAFGKTGKPVDWGSFGNLEHEAAYLGERIRAQAAAGEGGGR